jgi:hypothetical protein
VEGLEEGVLLKLVRLEGDEEELGAAETLGDEAGRSTWRARRPGIEGCDGGPEEGALLSLGWLEGDEEGSVEVDNDGPELGTVETLGEVLGELEGDVEG